jgi:SAM-dependent methyltransferase
MYDPVGGGDHMDYELGCCLPVSDWAWLNRTAIFENSALRRHVSPFPPPELMSNVSGLREEELFASQGVDFFLLLSAASPRPLHTYQRTLDFGCGCGRLARMFKGHPSEVYGCDIDWRHVKWIEENLPFVRASLTKVHPPLPYPDEYFDAIISISIFTHLTETSQNEFLAELRRISRPDAYLFLTIHGERALSRAVNEPGMREMLCVEENAFQRARKEFAEGKHAFILQHGHLTTSTSEPLCNTDRVISEPFEYGITFIPENYVRNHWGQWFNVEEYRHGALHSFQDLLVLSPRR